MARLEIEIGVNGHSKVKSNLADISNGVDKLNDKHSSLVKSIAEVTAVSRGLEGDLKNLNAQFRQGAITEALFNKESQEITSALSSARQSSAQFQSQLTSLNATIKQNSTGQNQYGESIKKLEGYHKSFNSGIRATNSIAIEFGRIVQDLPYGVQGVANNIQQLTTNFGYYATSVREAAKANGQVVTTSQILKGAFSSFLTPANLLTLSISAITAGWVAYEKWSQKAAKATKDNKKEVDEFNEGLKKFISTQDSATRAIASGLAESSSELSTLKALRSIIEDETISRNKRLSAVKEIQKLYPDYFKGLSNEKILTGQVESQYNRLTQSILASGKARAAIKNQAPEYEKLVNIDIRRESRLKSIDKINDRIYDSTIKLRNSLSGTNIDVFESVKTEEGLSNLQRTLKTLNAIDYPTNRKLLEGIIESTKQLNVYNKERTEDGLEEIKALQNINSLQKLVNNSVREGGNITGENLKLSQKEINALESARQRLTKAVEDSNNRIAVNSEENRKKELAQVEVVYSSWLNLAKNNATELAILENNKRSEIDVINAKWDAKELEQRQKLEDEITAIVGQSGIERVRTRESELKKNDLYFDGLLKKYKDNNNAIDELTEARRQTETQINAKYDEIDFQAMANHVSRLNRNREQALIEQLEQEYRLELAGTAKTQEEKNAIYTRFAKDRQAIIDEQSQRNIIANNDGSPLYREIAQAELELTNLQNKFREGLISPQAFEADRERLQSLITDLDLTRSVISDLGDLTSTSFMAILTDGENAADTISKAFKSMANQIIADLIRIQAVKALANIFSGGATGIFGKLLGFSSGGYTGNGGRNEVVGVVHGQEMVINAEATRKNRALLEAINSGRSVSPSSVSTPSAISSGTNRMIVEVVGEVSGQNLRIVQKRTEQKQVRFYANS